MFFILAMLMAAPATFGQVSKKEARAQEKARKKAAREAAQAANAEMVKGLIERAVMLTRPFIIS